MPRRPPLAVLSLAILAGCGAPAPLPSPDPGPPRRAILVSFDALSEQRALATVDPAAIPAFRRLFARASCTDGARPMFPSVTAASHAALWTGAWGDVNGTLANSMPSLPASERSLLELVSGYDARQRRAEPIWIAVARAGLPVVGHHVTQAPGPGGWWRPDGTQDTARIADERAWLARPGTFVANGYNRKVADARVLTGRDLAWHEAGAWTGLQALAPLASRGREASWAVGGDSLHALVVGRTGAEALLVGAGRDAASAVLVRLAPVDSAPVFGRPLARHFSDVLWLPSVAGRAGVYLRLWRLDASLAEVELFQSAAWLVEANAPDALAAYHAAVGAFIGNSETRLYASGAFGPRLGAGGTGGAEARYLESAELLTRQYMRGSEWLWRGRRPALQAEYFPLIDDVDHQWFGLVSPDAPGTTPYGRAALQRWRARAWSLADRRLAGLQALAREGGALLVASGDHGMRAVWRRFHPNVVLRDAGLLAADADGRRPDLARSVALNTYGTLVMVNGVGRKGGVVPADSVGAVVDRAAAALLAVRDEAGQPVVTRVWRRAEGDTLGFGGATGADLAFALAPGTWVSQGLTGAALQAYDEPTGVHGAPSLEADMHTVLCAEGPGVGGRRLPPGRVVDAAPTVVEWLGVGPLREARGRSVLGAMRR